MSQKKVDKYKNEKANRSTLQKKEQRIYNLEKLGVGLVCLLLAGWIGYSAYSLVTGSSSEEATTTEMDITAVTDYLQTLNEAE